jgi:hypothetical protein
MVLFTITQAVCVMLSVASLGHSMKKDASKFDRIVYCVCSVGYILLCVGLQGVK